MATNYSGVWTIALYVPDAAVAALSREADWEWLILDGAGELDFLRPGWWESAHTAHLGFIRVEHPKAQGSQPSPSAEPLGSEPRELKNAASPNPVGER